MPPATEAVQALSTASFNAASRVTPPPLTPSTGPDARTLPVLDSIKAQRPEQRAKYILSISEENLEFSSSTTRWPAPIDPDLTLSASPSRQAVASSDVNPAALALKLKRERRPLMVEKYFFSTWPSLVPSSSTTTPTPTHNLESVKLRETRETASMAARRRMSLSDSPPIGASRLP